MRILLILFILCSYPFCLSAVDLERAVEMLEATGDFETAEPVAFKLTQEKPEHYYRIEFLRKYPNSDFAETVYLQTWKDVKDAGNIAKLQSFVKVMPRGIHSLEGLERLFALYTAADVRESERTGARRQAEKSCRCAGVLTKKGKYPMFSGCP